MVHANTLDSLVRSRTLSSAIFRIDHLPDGLPKKNRSVHGREPADLSLRSLIEARNLAFRMNLDRSNIVRRLRKKHVHLHRVARSRRAFRAHVNTPAAYIRAATFTALHDSAFIAPGKHHCQPQTKSFRVPSFFCNLVHAGLWLTTAIPASSRQMRMWQLYASPKNCKDDDSGMLRTTPF